MLSLNRALVASRYLLAEEKTYLTVLRRSAIVTATMNETRCFSQEAGGVGITVVLCLQLVISLVGNSFIAIVVYKTKSQLLAYFGKNFVSLNFVAFLDRCKFN